MARSVTRQWPPAVEVDEIEVARDLSTGADISDRFTLPAQVRDIVTSRSTGSRGEVHGSKTRSSSKPVGKQQPFIEGPGEDSPPLGSVTTSLAVPQ